MQLQDCDIREKMFRQFGYNDICNKIIEDLMKMEEVKLPFLKRFSKKKSILFLQ